MIIQKRCSAILIRRASLVRFFFFYATCVVIIIIQEISLAPEIQLTFFTHLALESLGCLLKVVQFLLEVFAGFGHEEQDVGLDVSSEDFGGRLREMKREEKNT